MKTPTKKEKTAKPKKTAGTKTSLKDENNELVYDACYQFLYYGRNESDIKGTTDGSSKGVATAVAKYLAEKYGRPDITREKIYPLVRRGFDLKYVFLQPPVEKELGAKLISTFDLNSYLDSPDDSIKVVNVSGKEASRHVTSYAADGIVQLICDVEEAKKREAIENGKDPDEVRVHLGIGAGAAAEQIATRLASRTSSQIPKLTLHAISAGGYYVEKPENDPTTYLSYFKDLKPECVGFVSTPIVQGKTYDDIKREPSLRYAFKRRDEIDVIVTSLASADDADGLVRQYLGNLKRNDWIDEDALETLKEGNWVGDVLFRPYSAEKPIDAKSIQTVTLFDIPDLVKFVKRPNKYVVLICAPCKNCGKLKTNALRPLLKNESLRVWNRLYVDRETTERLIRDEELAKKE